MSAYIDTGETVTYVTENLISPEIFSLAIMFITAGRKGMNVYDKLQLWM